MKRKPNPAATHVFYVYLIGRAADVVKVMSQKSLPSALEPDSPIEVITEGSVAAIVSAAPTDQYGEGKFEHGFVSGGSGFLRKKSDRCVLLDGDRSLIGRDLTEQKRKQR